MRFETTDLEDAERRASERDRTAFATLRHAYEDVVYRYFLFKTNNRALSSDLAVAVFDTAWESIDRYPWRDFSFHVWLLRIAKAKLIEAGVTDDPSRPRSDRT